MGNLSAKAQYSVAQQHDMLRRAKDDFGLDAATLARKIGVSKSAVKGWQDGSAMPAWALGALCEAGVPDELASLVTDPFNRYVGSADETDGDLDELATLCGEFLAEYAKARHPKSPGNIQIVHTEKPKLVEIRQRLRAHARKAA